MPSNILQKLVMEAQATLKPSGQQNPREWRHAQDLQASGYICQDHVRVVWRNQEYGPVSPQGRPRLGEREQGFSGQELRPRRNHGNRGPGNLQTSRGGHWVSRRSWERGRRQISEARVTPADIWITSVIQKSPSKPTSSNPSRAFKHPAEFFT